jgi:O-antigen/teichoic acid export membrane protein
MACGLLGLWAFTNLEVAYALLRVEERRRTYAAASAINVVLTVVLTVLLVVVLDWGARGYVLGNYAASTAVLLGLWWREREKLAVRPVMPLGPLLRFGAPTIPAEATVFTLNVIDRAYLLRAESPRRPASTPSPSSSRRR